MGITTVEVGSNGVGPAQKQCDHERKLLVGTNRAMAPHVGMSRPVARSGGRTAAEAWNFVGALMRLAKHPAPTWGAIYTLTTRYCTYGDNPNRRLEGR